MDLFEGKCIYLVKNKFMLVKFTKNLLVITKTNIVSLKKAVALFFSLKLHNRNLHTMSIFYIRKSLGILINTMHDTYAINRLHQVNGKVLIAISIFSIASQR